MIIVVSPAKTLDYESPLSTSLNSQPALLDHSQELINRMKTFSPVDIAELMDISMKLAELNFERLQTWQQPFTTENARPSVMAFKGDVYEGLKAQTFSDDDLSYLQEHLRILSGLYGFLRPLDLMQAYRLEMGRKLKTERGKNLYEFWGDIVTDALNADLKVQPNKMLINLASNEYFKVINKRKLDAEIITPQFKDWKNGRYKMISFYAKRARGMMARFITLNRLESIDQIKDFSEDGYHYDGSMSEANNWVFTRRTT